VAPILGSLLIFFFGFTALFLTAGFFVLLAALTLIFSARDKPFHDARFLTSFALFKKHLKTFLAYLGWGGETALYGNLWPIFLILILGDILSYGGIITISILFSVLVIFLIGRWVDKAKGSRVLTYGVALGSFSWLLRTIAYFPFLIILVDGFYRLTEQMMTIPMDVLSYKKAISGGTSQSLYFREIALSLGAFLFLALASLMIFLCFSIEKSELSTVNSAKLDLAIRSWLFPNTSLIREADRSVFGSLFRAMRIAPSFTSLKVSSLTSGRIKRANEDKFISSCEKASSIKGLFLRICSTAEGTVIMLII